MESQGTMGNKTSRRNIERTPTHSIRVADKFWHEWEIAAKLANIDRNRFIITVVNNAAQQIIKDAQNDGE